MQKKIKLDFLNFSQKANLVNNEQVFLSCLVTKFNDMGYRQERSLVLTNNAIYNIKRTQVKRRIPYEELESITVSNMSSEFVLHIKKSYDYRLLSLEKRQILIETIMKIMSKEKQICSAFTIFYVPLINLNKVTTTHNQAKNKQFVRPSENYAKIMDLDKYINEEQQDQLRKTELRKKTTMLFNNKQKDKEICLEDFELQKVLGRGAFGKVILAQKKDNLKLYAIKVLKKSMILELDQMEHTKAEKKVLSHINNPFLVNLEFAFQTPEKLYFVMEFMQGGELFQHLRSQKKFSEELTRFYAACIVLALNHMHNKNYIYRDLKLENILLDTNGYAKLTDFGLAKFIEKDDQALTFCGTPDYLAPEVILQKGHNRPADWWTLGVLTYEMLYGIPPFYAGQINTMYRKIIKEPVIFKPNTKVSPEAKDFVTKLLQKNPKMRLGTQAGSLEIMNHPFFKSIVWEKLMSKQIPAPFIPSVSGDSWLKNFDQDFTKEDVRDSQGKVDLEKLKEFQKEFESLNYNREEDNQ